jgi:hypothetical protein
MSDLLDTPPFSARDDASLLRAMNEATHWHLAGCPAYRAVWPAFTDAASLHQLPFLHVGVFKHRVWRTSGDGISHQRTLKSSSTSGISSQITLDTRSGPLQARSSNAILQDLLGTDQRPLLVLDDVKSLQQRGEVSARATAAMSLRPLATEMHFLLQGVDTPQSLDWKKVVTLCRSNRRLLVYGFTWLLWKGWAEAAMPEEARRALAGTQVHFVHSGGWKKLESLQVSRERFDKALLATCAAGSAVLDFYGLVEQVGIIYPLCSAGFRHVPRWAAVIVRDPWTLQPLADASGMIQLMNPLAFGAPYHNVLTEDIGRFGGDGVCPCGRVGQRFELLGRIPKAEVRGCANV